MKKLNFGILGTGWIANEMADTLARSGDANLYAVASRETARAKAFAARYGIRKAYGSDAELLADPDVDVVYVASPHSRHAEQMLACLDAGKHILCEKAFTVTAKQAREVLARAREKKRVVAEAIWPRYMPMAKTIRDFCASDRIGRVYAVYCNLGYPVAGVPRLREPELAGGALLDVGVYTLNFAALVLGGEVTGFTSSAVKNELGVDTQGSIALTYSGGRMATLLYSVLGTTDRLGVIYGEKGYALVENINNFESLRAYDDDYNLIERVERPPQVTGYEYEVRAITEAILSGASECPDMPHAETIRIMELMDGIRHSWGLWYPGEKTE
ncbi:MAG TPA: Gfo/Idh/MocA family oxidoreductase [Clostridia bacterium]|nr:Gfo/Idh/MocA family oxidoreductase [Clostridia bacterium]HOS19164.1 Gfo/Idh/MocA family oxidoreductase [Clostridia bacterium]HPK16372.1 Gfo/Idh/MocA family oxidoreductase [Clostridia bacterium]